MLTRELQLFQLNSLERLYYSNKLFALVQGTQTVVTNVSSGLLLYISVNYGYVVQDQYTLPSPFTETEGATETFAVYHHWQIIVKLFQNLQMKHYKPIYLRGFHAIDKCSLVPQTLWLQGAYRLEIISARSFWSGRL